MTTDNTFTTLPQDKQAKIVHDLMELFRSNERGYGVGEFQGAHFDEDKNKWYPGGVRWAWGVTTADKWYDHLSGVRLLGQGVLCDDNKVWYTCLDIDMYDIDYVEEMVKIIRSNLPVVVFRTKSGGLRIVVFFSEAIEGELVIPRMRKLAALLGYGHCEIFPKQSKLDVANGDCPSWIYMPLGASGGVFPEQGCMNEAGNLMELVECVEYAKGKRISRSTFLGLFAADETARTNGKTNGKKHRQGAWVEEESYEVTLNTMFHDGPVCLWIIAHNKSRNMQNNFLFNTAMFLKEKYPENWGKALTWVNLNVLQPVGDLDKLHDLIKRAPDKNYMCQQDPICHHCNPHACRNMRYGVGQNGRKVDYHDLGLTIMDRIPAVFFVSFGENNEVRMRLTSSELRKLDSFKDKCMDHGLTIPPNMNKAEWETIVNKNIEVATHVEPTHAMRTSAHEIEILTKFFSGRVPTFLRVGEKGKSDSVRVRLEERKIYFKWDSLMIFIERVFSNKDVDSVRYFIDDKQNCEYYRQGRGHRDWWRYTYAISFDKLDEYDVESWLVSGGVQKEEEE